MPGLILSMVRLENIASCRDKFTSAIARKAQFWHVISSCECKKVVSDILGEIKFVVDLESTCKITHFSHGTSLNSKFLHFYEQNKMSKNNEIQRKSEHKIGISTKWQKCTYDLLTFNWRYAIEDRR